MVAVTVDPAAPVRVLTVCTGNICRSPAVERLLAAGAGGAFRGDVAAGGIEVGSAGTRAVVGSAMSPQMAALVASRGLVADRFVARQLDAAAVREADVVLALTRSHRSAVVELVPAAVRRTYTLRELARLAPLVDPADLAAAGPTPAERLRALATLAAAQRGRVHATPDEDDVVDPIGQSDALYARVFDQMAQAVDVIVGTLRRS
ncbi:low molecular weight phosphatase family protein [Cellulomonas sp. H30R-01]|nr:low molecular weight phosphatase family protein [Cellulomonas sp. H30R-01]